MTIKSVLDMDSSEARKFFLKPSSYFNVKLPSYIKLDEVITEADKIIGKSDLDSIIVTNNYLLGLNRDNNDSNLELLKNCSNVNMSLIGNKDARYSWRNFQMIHPVLYVDLVNVITKKDNWLSLQNRFSDFRNDSRIECISIPAESRSNKSDKAEQILNWWRNLEQYQIKLALDYNYCIHSDITDCYPSMYTHTIAWSLMGKSEAKIKREKRLFPNLLDGKIQQLQNGQTNGIPQGSTLMDFIAEIILGYADLQISEMVKNKNITDFKILRYRDDYRIFSNNKDEAELIMKIISDLLFDLNLKVNSKKTFLCDDIILDGIKNDKLYWTHRSLGFFHYKLKKNNSSEYKKVREYNLTLQKHLLEIKILSEKFPNCGQLSRALTDFYTFRLYHLERGKNQVEDVRQLISILTSMMKNNPKVIELCITNITKLLEFIEDLSEMEVIIDSIVKKFINLPNSDFVNIWLQRICLINNYNIDFDCKLCNKVNNPSIKL